MLLEELIEKAFSDGYEYALMEQREYAYLDSAAGLVKKSLSPSSKSAGMLEKIQKARESALKARADFKKRMNPTPAKATGYIKG